MLDMTAVTAPKSDQINGEDLRPGPQTFTIESVKIDPNKEQPTDISLVGEKRVWRPCKSMVRVLTRVWGYDGKLYSGRLVTLYFDPTVRFGKDVIGGIRISHMSHITSSMVIPLQASRGKFAAHTVQPLVLSKAQPEPKPIEPAEAAEMIKSAESVGELRAAFGEVYKSFETYDDATRAALTDLKDAVKLELEEGR
jgi:hypothetical protein